MVVCTWIDPCLAMPRGAGYLCKSLIFSQPLSNKSRQGTWGFRDSQPVHLPLKLPPRDAALGPHPFSHTGFVMV